MGSNRIARVARLKYLLKMATLPKLISSMALSPDQASEVYSSLPSFSSIVANSEFLVSEPLVVRLGRNPATAPWSFQPRPHLENLS